MEDKQTEPQEYDPKKAQEYIEAKFIEQGDFPVITDGETLSRMIAGVMELDETFMRESGVDDGAVYDDDAAYDYLFEQMALRFPDYKMYMMRLVEDYMDYSEQYLDSIGAIDWE